MLLISRDTFSDSIGENERSMTEPHYFPELSIAGSFDFS